MIYAISYMCAIIQCNSYHLEHLIRIFDSYLMVLITYTKDIRAIHLPIILNTIMRAKAEYVSKSYGGTSYL